MNKNVDKVLKAISSDIVKLAREIIDSDIGINEKVGINTLSGSDLYKQISSSVDEEGDNIVMNTFFNFYLVYIEWDRPPKYGSPPPKDAIIKWLKKKRIVSSNENIETVANAFRWSIWYKGWKGRKILQELDRMCGKQFDEKWSDMLFNALIADIDDWFS